MPVEQSTSLALSTTTTTVTTTVVVAPEVTTVGSGNDTGNDETASLDPHDITHYTIHGFYSILFFILFLYLKKCFQPRCSPSKTPKSPQPTTSTTPFISALNDPQHPINNPPSTNNPKSTPTDESLYLTPNN